MRETPVVDDEFVFGWCERALGRPPVEVLFRSGHLSRVIGVRLADDRLIVIKDRPFERRLKGCAEVQAYLAAAGFPCPRPLAGPEEIRGRALSAETLVAGGDLLSTDHAAARFASLLASLVRRAPAVTEVANLTPAPPWAAWDHPGPGVWPVKDDHDRDLNRVHGPEWLDRSAGAVREKLVGHCGAPCVGHGDWESQNIRWDGEQSPLAVHDWDSVIAQPEPAIAGLASAVWPAAGAAGEAATVDQSSEFLCAYQTARGQGWSRQDEQAAWAAGLWVRLFNAKKDAGAGGGAQLERLQAELKERMSRAGLSL